MNPKRSAQPSRARRAPDGGRHNHQGLGEPFALHESDCKTPGQQTPARNDEKLNLMGPDPWYLQAPNLQIPSNKQSLICAHRPRIPISGSLEFGRHVERAAHVRCKCVIRSCVLLHLPPCGILSEAVVFLRIRRSKRARLRLPLILEPDMLSP